MFCWSWTMKPIIPGVVGRSCSYEPSFFKFSNCAWSKVLRLFQAIIPQLDRFTICFPFILLGWNERSANFGIIPNWFSPMSLSKASWVFLGGTFFFHELVHPLHHQIRQPHHPVLPWLPAHTGSEGQRVSLVSMKPPSMTLAPRKCHTNMYIVGPVYIIICIYIFYIQPCVDIFIIYISHILQEVAIAMKQINGITHVGTIL